MLLCLLACAHGCPILLYSLIIARLRFGFRTGEKLAFSLRFMMRPAQLQKLGMARQMKGILGVMNGVRLSHEPTSAFPHLDPLRPLLLAVGTNDGSAATHKIPFVQAGVGVCSSHTSTQKFGACLRMSRLWCLPSHWRTHHQGACLSSSRVSLLLAVAGLDLKGGV